MARWWLSVGWYCARFLTNAYSSYRACGKAWSARAAAAIVCASRELERARHVERMWHAVVEGRDASHDDAVLETSKNGITYNCLRFVCEYVI